MKDPAHHLYSIEPHVKNSKIYLPPAYPFAIKPNVLLILYHIVFLESFNILCYCAFIFVLNLDIGICCCYELRGLAELLYVVILCLLLCHFNHCH